ncbi:MAG TPA: TolC family protein [Steroidobacteraceae bacterium]|jgi:cobalt-zinc-cadmium efflux system outer membrane protein|nr:TolC family protein [Steroidobacteraceae bacterium]
MLLRLRRLLLAGLVVSSFPIGAGAPPTVGLREAIAAALAGNPDLRMFEFEFRAAAAVRDQAALRPAPVAALEIENFGGTGDTQGLRAAEATLSLSQVVELGGKRESRIAVAVAGRDTLTTARQATQLDVLAEVTRRFIAVATLQEVARLDQRASELAERTVQAADLRVRAAKAPHVELDRATVALERARLDLRGTRSRLDAAGRSLAAMWGADDASIDGRPLGEVRGDLFQLPQVEDFAALIARLQAGPDFLRFASEERLRDAELRLAATQRRPDITLGGGLRRLQDSRDVALVASFSIPLFSGRRAESYIAEAAARRDAVGAAREAAFVKARAQLYGLYRELREAAATVNALDATLIPKMEEALKETEYAFERGRYSYLELVDAQREYLDVQRARIEAGAQTQILATEIERLTNAPLTTP